METTRRLMNLSTNVTCPTCFEPFETIPPPPSEVPCTVDYDCEICCRPMTIHYWQDDTSGNVIAEAYGLSD